MTNKMGQKKFREKSLRDFYYVFFRRRVLVVTSFCLIFLLTALGTLLAPKVYQSEALLMVKLGRESVKLDPTAAMGQVLSIQQSRESEVKTELEILESQALAGEVVDSVGTDVFLSEKSIFSISGLDKAFSLLSPDQGESSDPMILRNKIVRDFVKRLKVDVQKSSNMLHISFDAQDPRLAQNVLNKLIDLYMEKHISVHRTAGSDEFFLLQTEELRARVAQTENELRELKNRSGVASVSDQRLSIITRIADLQKELAGTERTLASTVQKNQIMRKLLSNIPQAIVRMKVVGVTGTNFLDYMHQRLVDLDMKEQDLLSTLTDQHRLVDEVRRQKGEINSLLAKQEGTHSQMIQLALLSDEAAIPELTSRIQSLKTDLAQSESRLKDLNDADMQIAQLQRELDLQTASYRNYSEKLEQTRIDRALETGKISNISVVQPSMLPVKHIRPQTVVNLAVGLLLGICVSIGGAFFVESLDHSFSTPDDVEDRLQIPALVAIPCLRKSADKTRSKVQDAVPGKTSPCPQCIPSFLARYYEVLVNTISISATEATEGVRVIAVTSCYSGEGTSTISCNLAMALAGNADGRVLLVDANIRKPSLHKLFDTPLSPGLTEVILKEQTNPGNVESFAGGNLDFIPCGQRVVNFAQLFDSRAFIEVLELWKREYSYIVFDSGAVAELSATIRLLRLVDTTLLVLEAERTRFEVAQRVKESLEQSQSKLLGVVLNKRRFHVPQWLYRHI